MYILKKRTTAKYEGERVRILEIIRDTAYIWIPSRGIEISLTFPNKKLTDFKPKIKEIN